MYIISIIWNNIFLKKYVYTLKMIYEKLEHKKQKLRNWFFFTHLDAILFFYLTSCNDFHNTTNVLWKSQLNLF